MEVILKEDVPKLGHRGEVVKVAEGYGRNYLLPHKLAIEATTANRAVIEQMKQSAVRKSAVEKADADALSKQLDGTALSFQRKVGERDHLFGSVTSSDIADALESDLQPLVTSGLITRISKYDTNPAKNPQPPPRSRK